MKMSFSRLGDTLWSLQWEMPGPSRARLCADEGRSQGVPSTERMNGGGQAPKPTALVPGTMWENCLSGQVALVVAGRLLCLSWLSSM